MRVKRDTPFSDVPDVPDADPDYEPESFGVLTPRGTPWSNEHLTTDDELPVVTAKKEPTQRGLGIPPPPSSSEAPWEHRFPSLASPSPLSEDAFEPSVPRTVAPAGADAEVPSVGDDRGAEDPQGAPDPTENERITVRAPAPAGAPSRRRVLWLALAAAALLLIGVLLRRATEPARAVATARPTAESTAPSVVLAPPIAAPAEVTGQANPEDTPLQHALPPSQSTTQVAGVARGAPATLASAAPGAPHLTEARLDKRRRPPADPTSLEAKVPGSETVDPWRRTPPSPPTSQNKPIFSLPPR